MASDTYCISKKIRNDGFIPSHTSIDGLHKMIDGTKFKKRGEIIKLPSYYSCILNIVI